MKYNLTLFIFCIIQLAVICQPSVVFEKTFGGNSYDYGSCVQQTSDNGFIIVGDSWYNGAGMDDVYLVKTDSEGNKLWEKRFGGQYVDFGTSVRQTSDKGYIITGVINQSSPTYDDCYIIKTDSLGNTQWEKTYSGTWSVQGSCIQITVDNGYVISGFNSLDGTYDMYLLKVDSNGNKIWDNMYGGNSYEDGNYVEQTSDSGYIVIGSTFSMGAGSYDIYLVKTNVNGVLIWSKTFGTTDAEYGVSVKQTNDNGYILLGRSNNKAMVIKLNQSGDKIWEKEYLGIEGREIIATEEGGYVIGGLKDSDMYLMSIDTNGDLVWELSVGGTALDQAESLIQTPDGGFAIIGGTESYGIGPSDVYLVKTSNVNPSPLWRKLGDFNSQVNCLAVLDSNIIFAGLYSGKMYRTTNGGTTWTPITISSSPIRRIVINSNNDLFIGTDAGLYRSSNLGNTNELIFNGTISDMAINSQNNLFVSLIGVHGIAFSSDNGNTWSLLPTPSSNRSISIDSNDEIVIGSSTGIYKSVNNGSSWEQILACNNFLLSIKKFGDRILAATYSNFVYFTKDNGISWDTISVNINQTFSTFISESHQIYVGGYGNLIKSINDGLSWFHYKGDLTNPLVFEFTNDENGYIYISSGLSIYKTIKPEELDGWHLQVSNTFNLLSKVYLIDQSIGLVVGSLGTILKTTNGGSSWYSQQSGTFYNLWGISFCNSNYGIAVGEGGTILKTTNGGSNWYIQTSGTTARLNSVSFIDVNNALIVGENSLILKTTDGGATWVQRSSGTGSWIYLNGVKHIDVNNAFAVGSLGTILKTSDGGATWIQQSSGTTYALMNIAFSSSSRGLAVGNNGIILLTTDGGVNWSTKFLNTDNLWDISFPDAMNATAVGSNGLILRSINGGQSWYHQYSGTANNLLGVCLSDYNTGIAVGSSGTILKTGNSYVTNVGEDGFYRPNEFLLSQNYPNPFNPSTTIKYFIPKFSHVIIKVFDILGNEIETLVNEEKSAGRHELSWNAANIPSGVYLYRLQVGNLVEVKKMIILK